MILMFVPVPVPCKIVFVCTGVGVLGAHFLGTQLYLLWLNRKQPANTAEKLQAYRYEMEVLVHLLKSIKERNQLTT
jgi:hypothetical protein